MSTRQLQCYSSAKQVNDRCVRINYPLIPAPPHAPAPVHLAQLSLSITLRQKLKDTTVPPGRFIQSAARRHFSLLFCRLFLKSGCSKNAGSEIEECITIFLSGLGLGTALKDC